MRSLLLFSLLVTGGASLFAQAAPAKPAQPQTTPPATAKPAPAQKPPATAKPAQSTRRQPAGRSGIALTVTDMRGTTIPGVHVDVAGPTARMGETDSGGQVNFPGLQAGTYKLRFTGDPVITFEKEVTLRAGQVANFDVSLSEAPPKPEPPPPAATAAPPPPATAVGPVGQPQALSVPDVLEEEYIGRQPRRESLLSCSGNTRTTMIQLNEPQPERLYSDADAVYYVIGGEGNAVIDGKELRLATNGFVSVPRETAHSFERRGNRPLILLAVLSGSPCETAK
jgi:hypothetical protein